MATLAQSEIVSLPVLSFVDEGETQPPRHQPPTMEATNSRGKSTPSITFVPHENVPANTKDELTAFRLARRLRTPGLYFAARVTADVGSYKGGQLVVFDYEATPKHGDIVCAVAHVQAKADTWLNRTVDYLAGNSFRLEKLVDRLQVPRRQPSERIYVLRRYVVDRTMKPMPEADYTGVPDQGRFRLEALDGSECMVNSSTCICLPWGLATGLKPWGWHRDVVEVL